MAVNPLAVFVFFPRRVVHAPTRLMGISLFSISRGMCSALQGVRYNDETTPTQLPPYASFR